LLRVEFFQLYPASDNAHLQLDILGCGSLDQIIGVIGHEYLVKVTGNVVLVWGSFEYLIGFWMVCNSVWGKFMW
jgi:hypothetical protein